MKALTTLPSPPPLPTSNTSKQDDSISQLKHHVLKCKSNFSSLSTHPDKRIENKTNKQIKENHKSNKVRSATRRNKMSATKDRFSLFFFFFGGKIFGGHFYPFVLPSLWYLGRAMVNFLSREQE